MSWYSPRGSYTEIRPRAMISMPSRGSNFIRRLNPRNIAALICAPESLRVKYQWPLEARVKFDTSPATHTHGNFASIVPRTCAVSCETVSVTGGSSLGAALIGVGRGRSDRPADRAYSIAIRGVRTQRDLPTPGL